MTYQKWFGEKCLRLIFSEENNLFLERMANWIWIGIGSFEHSAHGDGIWMTIDRDTANIFKGCYQSDFMAPFIDRLQEINNDPKVAKLLEEAALLYAS